MKKLWRIFIVWSFYVLANCVLADDVPWYDAGKKYNDYLSSNAWKVLDSPYSEIVYMLKKPRKLNFFCASKVEKYRFDKVNNNLHLFGPEEIVTELYISYVNEGCKCQYGGGFFLYRRKGLALDMKLVENLLKKSEETRSSKVSQEYDHFNLKLFGDLDIVSIVLSKKTDRYSQFIVSYSNPDISGYIVGLTVNVDPNSVKLARVEKGGVAE